MQTKELIKYLEDNAYRWLSFIREEEFKEFILKETIEFIKKNPNKRKLNEHNAISYCKGIAGVIYAVRRENPGAIKKPKRKKAKKRSSNRRTNSK